MTTSTASIAMARPILRNIASLTADEWKSLSELAERLEQSWANGPPGDSLSELLATVPESLWGTFLPELVKVEQELACNHGTLRPLERYLEEFPQLAADDDTVTQLLTAECLSRMAAGDLPSKEELQRRFPRIADRIDLLELKDVLGREAWSADVLVSELEVGEQFGRYSIRRRLGAGEMAVVYLAYDETLGREVALKMPHPELMCDASIANRFTSEARALAAVEHPGVCTVHDSGCVNGQYFLTMKPVDGPTLAEWRRGKNLSCREIAALTLKIGEALAAVHGKGLVHRDVKSGNIMIGKDGQPLLMDFGLALHGDEPARWQSTRLMSGTPASMAPEQVTADGEQIDARTDIYGLGVVLYELLTGVIPFRGSLGRVLADVVHRTPPRPSSLRHDVDHRLERICLKAMAKQPTQRYQSADELCGDLRRYLSKARTRTWWGIGLASGCAAVVVFALAWRARPTVPEGGSMIRPDKEWNLSRGSAWQNPIDIQPEPLGRADVTNVLRQPGEHHLYRLVSNGDGWLQITLDGKGGTLDPLVSVYRASGALNKEIQILDFDDGVFGRHAAVSVPKGKYEVFHIEVAGKGSTTGVYRLLTNERGERPPWANPEVSWGKPQPRERALRTKGYPQRVQMAADKVAIVDGVLEREGSEHWFAFDAPWNGMLVAQIDKPEGSLAPLMQVYHRGRVIAESEHVLNVSLREGDEYHLRVTSHPDPQPPEEPIGGYIVRLRRTPEEISADVGKNP